MADYDLSTYEGRQAARDDGLWVGDDGGGGVTVENIYGGGGETVQSYSGPVYNSSGQQINAPSSGGGGGGGGGGAPPQDPRSVGTNQYGDGVFNTGNGQKTGTQIVQELRAIGWDGQGDPVSVYLNLAPARAGTNMSGTPAPGAQPAPQTAGGITRAQYDAMIAKVNDALNQATMSAADRFRLEQERLGLERERLNLERDSVALNREKAESDMQLARNADARAQAMLQIQQADLQLRQNAAAQAKVQYETDMAQRKYEFEVQKAQQEYEFNKNLVQRQTEFTQTQYSNLAQTLLQGAASLRGPRDWMKYAEFTGGGSDLVSQMTGGKPSPAFGGERGPSPAISVGDVMGQLGFLTGQPGQAGVPTQPGQAAGGAARQQIPNVPLPHQVNPAAWDSMSESARQLALGLAEGGMTERGVYTPEDYERLLNASRPVGSAARITKQQFQSPVGAF